MDFVLWINWFLCETGIKYFYFSQPKSWVSFQASKWCFLKHAKPLVSLRETWHFDWDVSHNLHRKSLFFLGQPPHQTTLPFWVLWIVIVYFVLHSNAPAATLGHIKLLGFQYGFSPIPSCVEHLGPSSDTDLEGSGNFRTWCLAGGSRLLGHVLWSLYLVPSLPRPLILVPMVNSLLLYTPGGCNVLLCIWSRRRKPGDRELSTCRLLSEILSVLRKVCYPWISRYLHFS